jgi:uncharacterized membrane protein
MRKHIALMIALAALTSGAIGGLLFAFSNVVMPSLQKQPSDSAVKSMQTVNLQIVNPLFLALFLAPALLSLALLFLAYRVASQPWAPFIFWASGLYLLGVIGITFACNIPMNNRLASWRSNLLPTRDFWEDYGRAWTNWNHLRTLAALGSSLAFSLALPYAHS